MTIQYPTTLATEQIQMLGDDPHGIKKRDWELSQLDQSQIDAIAEGMLRGKSRDALRYALADGNYMDFIPQPWEENGDTHGLGNFSKAARESYIRSVKLQMSDGIKHDHSPEADVFRRSVINAIENSANAKITTVLESAGQVRQMGTQVSWASGYSFNVMIRQPAAIQELVLPNLIEFNKGQ